MSVCSFSQPGRVGRIASMLLVLTAGILAMVRPGIPHLAAASTPASDVWLWGDYPDNQTSSCANPATGSLTPVPVAGLTGVATLAAGKDFVAALKTDGTVWTWGGNPYGELGNGTSDNGEPLGVTTPHQVLKLTRVTAIATSPPAQHMLAITQDGHLWAWGNGDFGQLGNGKTVDSVPEHEFSSVPILVPGLSHVITIGAGDQFSLAVTADGQGWEWGTDYGALGAPKVTSHLTPVPVAGLDGAVSIAGSDSFALALKRDGTVWGWGWNNEGQLGLGQADDTPHPAFAPIPGLVDVTSIAAGRDYGVALKRDGTVWMWGAGYLGNGTTFSARPVQVPGLTQVVAIAAGAYHTLALEQDGTVWSWGDNEYGQLGHPPCVPDSAEPMPNTPAPVAQLSGVTAIAAGFFDSLAVTAPAPTGPDPAKPNCQYFPQTQHNLCGGFAAYWNRFGGLAVFGYPLTDAFPVRGVTVQYFERARFEWRPGSNPTAYDVELGLLGDELTATRRGTAPFQPVVAEPGCTDFSATGHDLCAGFRAYWERYGGLAIYGMPISEEFQENGLTVQYFERARFEWHPGSDPGRFDVELARLGAAELANQPR